MKRSSQRPCDICGDNFVKARPLQVVCSYLCGLKLQDRAKRKVIDAKAKSERRELKERKDAIKPLNKWLAEAQTEFNRYIRIRDHFAGCISCGASREEVEQGQAWKPGGAWDAGHFRSRGSASHLRFNTLNCHKQCKSCNGGDGNWGHTNRKSETIHEQYRASLVERIGWARVSRLECDNTPRTFDIEYTKRVKRIFARRTRHYRKLRAVV